MIKQSDIIAVVDLQNQRLEQKEVGLVRDLLSVLPLDLFNHALIISGIR